MIIPTTTSPWRTRNGVIVAVSMAILVVALAAAATAHLAGNDAVSGPAVVLALVALTSAVTFAYRQDIAGQRQRTTTLSDQEKPLTHGVTDGR